MKLPTYSQQQVQQEGLPGVRVSGATVDLSPIAQGIQGAGEVIQQANYEADKLVAQDRLNQFKLYQNQEEDQLKQLQGEAAIKPDSSGKTPAQLSQDRLMKKQAELQKDLGRGAQKMFGVMVMPSNLQYDEFSRAHTRKESETYADNTFKSTVALSANNAVKAPLSEVATSLNLKEALGAASDRANQLGLTGKSREAFLTDAATPVISGTLAALLDSNKTTEAKNYLESKKELMSAGAYLKAKDQVEAGTDIVVGQAQALKHVEPYLTQEYASKGVPTIEILKAIQNDPVLQANPKAMAQSVSWAKLMISEKEKEWKYQDADRLGSAYQVWNKDRNVRKTLESPEARRLMTEDPKAYDAFRLHILSENDQAVNRSKVAQKSDHALFWAYYSNPEALAAMKDDKEIFALQDKIGTSLMYDLLNQRQKVIRAPREVAKEVKLDNDQFDSIAFKNGMNFVYNPKSKWTKEQADQYHTLRNTAEIAIEEQQKSGKVLDRTQRGKVLSDFLVKVPLEKKGFFGGQETKYAFQVRTPQGKLTGETKNEALKYLRDNEEERLKLQIKLEDAGLDITDDNMVEIYLRSLK